MQIKRNKAVRFQQGGLMPALVSYTPVVIPGPEENTKVDATTISSGSGKKDGMKFADIKELLKDMLPSDARFVMAKATQLMNTINDTDDFLSEYYPDTINNMYMEVYAMANEAKQNYADAQKVKDVLMAKDAMSEYAQDQYGQIYYMKKDGSVAKTRLKDANGKMLLTYGDLFDYRRKAVKGAYNDDYLQAMMQATSMKEVMGTVEGIIDKIGEQSFTQSAYTAKRNNQAAQGLEAILADARNGIYKITDTSKSATKEQKIAAVNTVLRLMPNNQKNYLNIRAAMTNSTVEEVLYEIIASREKTTAGREISKDTDLDSIDEKERLEKIKANAKKSTGTSGGNLQEINVARAFNERLGEKSLEQINNGSDNNYTYQAIVNRTTFNTDFDENGLMQVSKMLEGKDNLAGALDWNNASVSGANIPFTALKEFVINNNTLWDTYLPFKVDADGTIKPNMELLDRVTKKDQLLLEMGIDKRTGVNKDNYMAVNAELTNRGIDIQLDENGKPLGDYMRFAIIPTMAGKRTFDRLSGVQKGLYDVIENTDTAKRIAASTGVKTDNSMWPMFGWLDADQVYRGNIYIPAVENPVNAMTGSGENIKIKEEHSIPRLKFNETRANRQAYVEPEFTPEDIEDGV